MRLLLLDDGLSCEAIHGRLLYMDDNYTIHYWHELYQEEGAEVAGGVWVEKGWAAEMTAEQQQQRWRMGFGDAAAGDVRGWRMDQKPMASAIRDQRLSNCWRG